ncbi:class I SAM-dependent DNA methyltransferase [Neorhizobium galegae]|uniref:class I SAM-dependent DNA methyltransferase n=1 Tax=Neorhizobium galegae TaxID=399 RepID=UPI0006213479|nr:methyltransferase [Neorhizobium galegae]KAB1121820.1 methyltransferase domain-containing protein [Neorhizobium galegae]MCQ1808080.1 methyltransferase domain-containing protein [Neorhizobium galegae]CDZ64208.1 Putative methyltransferase (Contains TPR repeat) [Neorhizobium galegae bv. orientalis]
MPPSPFSSQFSSGDATADRRADYARMLAEGGDFAAAAELIEQALELTPDWAAGWFRLGEYRDKAGLGTAADAYRQTLALRPDDVFGARLKLALIGAELTPDRPPSRYVEGLFDDYADRFDTALVEKLGYSVPGKLAALVMPHGPFRSTVDLGCGTGLFGAEIRGRTERLEGFDLSLNMLAKAQAKGLYDHLGQSDLSLASDDSGLFGDLSPHRADLVSAADVLMYLGSLETVFPLVLELLAPAGLLAFSVEDAGEGEGFVLRDSLRYAHSEAFIRALLSRFGLEIIGVENTVIRMDAGKPVQGILFLSRKRG